MGNLREARPRPASLVAVATQDCATDFRLEWNLIVASAIVADNLVALWSVFTFGYFLRPALRTALRGHHVPLVKDLLLLFGEKEGLFTLNARGLDVRHIFLLSFEFRR
jgi:hypothetical protein